jgi:hypothetical protein
MLPSRKRAVRDQRYRTVHGSNQRSGRHGSCLARCPDGGAVRTAQVLRWRGRRQRLPAAALSRQVNEEWSFAQTLRHLVFITDAWASRTVLDQEKPYHPIGLPQSWYPPADAAALGIDLAAQPGYAEIMAARADRMAVMRRIVADLTDAGMGRLCRRSPAPGYADEDRSVIDCIGVVMDEEIEHNRFAVRDLAELEAS